MAEDDRRNLPASALARGARLASLPVGFAGRTTLGVGRRLIGAPADAVLSDVQRRTAEQVFAVLGQLKGGAMKFGQAMSIFESALPDELAGPYRETLTRLQDAAPPMSEATVHRVLAEELGPGWAEQLVELDSAPAASASIGQVHRGRWHDGTDVAVKLQYPGAAKALRSDLRQVARLARMLAPIAPAVDVRGLVTELQERMVEELDYRLEAETQAAFAAAFTDDPDIVVPGVVEHTERVLVSTWLDSSHSLAAVITGGTPSERDTYGEAYVRFLFAGPARTGLLHADPHPGNYRILPDGRLGVVDYGAVARLPDGMPPEIGRLLRHAVDGDYDAVTRGLRELGFLGPQARLDAETVEAYIGPFADPAREETFTFSREWLREQMQRVSAPTQQGIGTALQINLPREYLLIHRVWAGGIGVLSQLGATAHFRAIVEESLPGFAEG